MTEEDKKLIRTFETRLRNFMLLFDKQNEEIIILRQELKNKEQEIESLRISRLDLETQYTNLKTARTISLYDKDIKETKQRLTSLVREVDKCIALLNE